MEDSKARRVATFSLHLNMFYGPNTQGNPGTPPPYFLYGPLAELYPKKRSPKRCCNDGVCGGLRLHA